MTFFHHWYYLLLSKQKCVQCSHCRFRIRMREEEEEEGKNSKKMFAHEFICCYRSGMEEWKNVAIEREIFYIYEFRIWYFIVAIVARCFEAGVLLLYLMLLVAKSYASKQAINEQTNEWIKKNKRTKMRLIQNCWNSYTKEKKSFMYFSANACMVSIGLDCKYVSFEFRI